jgi:hypothetical protein
MEKTDTFNKQGTCKMQIIYVHVGKRLETRTDNRETRPLVREGARTGQDRNCETATNIWS